MKKRHVILSVLATSLLIVGCGKEKDSSDVLKDAVAKENNINAKEIKKEEVSSEYTKLLDAGISAIYEYNKGEETVAYGIKASAQGYDPTKIEYEVAYDADTNKILGIKIISEKETDEIGGALLSTESFLKQFEKLAISDIPEIDNQTGPTADQTLDGLKTSLFKISNYYLTEIKDEDAISIGYQNEENAIKSFFSSGVTLTNVTANYSNLSLNSYNEILSIYEVKNGTTTVGYGFIVTTSGLGSGLVYATAIEIETDNYKGLYSTKNNEHYGKDRLKNPSYLSQFNNLPIEDVEEEIDIVAGETLTTFGIKDSLQKVASYYTNNIKE